MQETAGSSQVEMLTGERLGWRKAFNSIHSGIPLGLFLVRTVTSRLKLGKWSLVLGEEDDVEDGDEWEEKKEGT